MKAKKKAKNGANGPFVTVRFQTIKHVWKSVDKLTSGAFVDMWRSELIACMPAILRPYQRRLTIERRSKFDPTGGEDGFCNTIS